MKKTMIAMMSMLLLSGICWSQDTETTANEAKYYDNAKVVRIKNVDGEGFVLRSYEEGNEEATANLPLFEKDTVGTTEGRLEIYLGRLNTLRLDADSAVVLEKIPQLRKTDLNVRVEKGSIYLDITSLDNERGIEIQTPDCGIFILDKGIYRVNVSEGSRTEVLVMEGIAEVAGQESSRNVRENQKIVMSAGEITDRPYYFTASEKDDFDNWNDAQNRELGYSRYSSSRYLQSGYEDSEYEMSRSGRWSYMSEFNSYAWIPYNTNPDWMPYANGRWVWNPFYGYTWVSYDTAGWFTHHYGRWHWSYSFGWHWIPGYHWSPAWVSWFGNDQYYGWCPLSWWNRPVIVINNRWDHNYDYRHGIPHHSRSTIIIRKSELSSANAQRVALNRNAPGQRDGLTLAYRGTAPGDRPALAKVTVVNAKGKAVTYKQNGIVSADKYQISGPESGNSKATVYKYNPAAGDKGSGSTYRKKGGDSYDQSTGGTVYKSKNSDTSSTRSRYSPSGSKTERSSGETSYRSKSGSSGKASSTSSSSSSSSSGTVKKKKDKPEYMSATGYGGGSGETAAAATYSRYQSKYSASGGTPRASYRAHGSEYQSPGDSGEYTSGIDTRDYYFGHKTSSVKSGTPAPSYNTRYSAPASSASRGYKSNSSASSYSPFTRSRSSGFSSGTSSYSAPSYSARYSAPASSASRGYKSSSSASSYSPSVRSQSSASSSSYRASQSSAATYHASPSSHSQSSTGSAKKKD